MQDDDEEYVVGPGKPPRETQFQKGKSGNPKGRPRKPKATPLDLLWQQELYAPMAITENGVNKQVPFAVAFIKTLKANALKGDAKSMRMIDNRITNDIKFRNHQVIQEFGDILAMSDDELKDVIGEEAARAMEEKAAASNSCFNKVPGSGKTWVKTADGGGYVSDDEIWHPPGTKSQEEPKK